MKIQKKQEIEFFGTKTGNANSIALGYATETKNFGEVAVGVMNKSTAAKDPNSSKGVCVDPDATLFSVGCGGSGERKNALEVKGDGSVIIPGENGDINIADKIKQAFDTDASIELVKSAENSLQYTLMVNNESRGSINIPKDQFLKNVTYDSEGKQLVFTFVTIDEDEHVERVPVGDLKDIYTAGEGINIDNNVISADFSSVMTAISDEKTQRETADNEIKSTLDTKADLDKKGYVKVEQLVPAITYDKETNSINGLFETVLLDRLDNIVKNENLANGWQYYDFDDMLYDDVVPQYIYDATADEHIEITATTYLDDITDGNGGDAFNTAKPLDLTHDLYLDNDQIGVIESIRKLKINKAVSDSILINENILEVPDNNNKITNNIVVSTAPNLISGEIDFKNNIIINASATGKMANAKNGILISTDNNAGIISGSIVIGSSNSNTTTKDCILIGNIKEHGQSNEINIGQRNTSGLNGIIIGNNSTSYNSSVGIGEYNTVTGAFNIAIGNNCNVSPSYVVCIGYHAKANIGYEKAIVIGDHATTGPDLTGYKIENAIAIGTKAQAVNKNSISIGTNSISASGSIAIGKNAKAQYSSCVAICSESNANYVTAINSSIKNHAKGGVYLGYFASYNNKDIQFAVGGNRPDNDDIYYNIEETLTYNNQHKKYIYGIGGYDGTNTAAEGIKSLQEVLADKADASAIPTKISQLTNDSGYLTEHQSLDNCVKIGDDNTPTQLFKGQGIATVNAQQLILGSPLGGVNIQPNSINVNSSSFTFKANPTEGLGFIANTISKGVILTPQGGVNSIGFDAKNANVEIGGSLVDQNTAGVVYNVNGNFVNLNPLYNFKTKFENSIVLNSALNNITAATTAEEVVTKFNALLTDLKNKGLMEADTTAE